MSEQWNTPSTQLLQCKRRLPAQARVRLSIGPGVTTALAPGRPAVANAKAKVLDRKSVVWGKGESVRVGIAGHSIVKKIILALETQTVYIKYESPTTRKES